MPTKCVKGDGSHWTGIGVPCTVRTRLLCWERGQKSYKHAEKALPVDTTTATRHSAWLIPHEAALVRTGRLSFCQWVESFL